MKSLLLQWSENRGGLCRVCVEVRSAKGECPSAIAVSEKAEVADLDEARGQDVKQEATDELDRIEGHDLDAVVVFGVAPAKAHLAVNEIQKPAVGDGDAVSIAGQVLQHMLGSAEGWLGIDDPFHGTQLPQQGVELTRVGEIGYGAEATEFSFLIRLLEQGQHLAPEQAAEHAHRQEESGSAVDPAGMIEGEPTGGNQAMQVRMVAQILAPGVEHGQHPDACTEMAGISGDGEQGFGSGARQQVIEQAGSA